MNKLPANTAIPVTRLLSIFVLVLSAFSFCLPTALAGYSVIPAPPIEHQFTYEIKPGAEKSGTILIENFDNTPVTISLYGADGTQSDQGTYALTTRFNKQQHLGQWITISQPVVTVGPREKKQVDFKITIPKDATPGTYSGGIAAETGGNLPGSKQYKDIISDGDGGTLQLPKTATVPTNNVTITSRFVVKIFVKIPGTVTYKYEWPDFSVLQQKGTYPTFRVEYKNLGNTIIRVQHKIEIKGFPSLPEPGPNSKFKLEKDALVIDPPIVTLLQKSDAIIPVRWDNAPDFGFYTATATSTFSKYDITTNKLTDTRTEIHELKFYIPIKLGSPIGLSLVTLALLILGSALFFSIRYLMLQDLIKNSKTYTIKEDDTLTDLAKTSHIGWKKLAHINKIKAPYILKPGQKILLPKKNK